MATPRRLYLLAGLTVLILAALLRVPSLTAARPYINYVDEGNLLHPVVRMLRTGAWDPRTYMYPQLPRTLTVTAARLYAPLHPSFQEGRTFQQDLSGARLTYDLLEPFELLFTARFLSFLASLGIVALTGLYGYRLLGAPAGLLAMLLAAWLPALVIRGGIATVDPWATLFALACFFFADRLRASGQTREAFLAGAMAGLAFASKYPAILAICGAGLILLLDERPWRHKLRWAAVGAAGVLTGLLAGMPALVLHPREVMVALRNQNELYTNLAATPRLWEQAIRRAEWDLPYDHPELGLPFLLLAAAGAAVGLRDRRLAKIAAGWLFFLAISLVLYLPKSFQAFRNLLPLVPLLCLLVAILYARVRERIARPVWVDAGAVLVVLALFGVPVTQWSWQRAGFDDSRTQAMDWLAEHSRPGQNVLILRELAFVQKEIDRLEGTVVVLRRAQSALAAAGNRRTDFLVLGKLEQLEGPPLDMAEHPAVRRNYVLRSRFGEAISPFQPGWWRGNRQVIYVFEQKERRWRGKDMKRATTKVALVQPPD